VVRGGQIRPQYEPNQVIDNAPKPVDLQRPWFEVCPPRPEKNELAPARLPKISKVPKPVPRTSSKISGQQSRVSTKSINRQDVALPRSQVKEDSKKSNSDLSSNYPVSPLSIPDTSKYYPPNSPSPSPCGDVTRYFNDQLGRDCPRTQNGAGAHWLEVGTVPSPTDLIAKYYDVFTYDLASYRAPVEVLSSSNDSLPNNSGMIKKLVCFQSGGSRSSLSSSPSLKSLASRESVFFENELTQLTSCIGRYNLELPNLLANLKTTRDLRSQVGVASNIRKSMSRFLAVPILGSDDRETDEENLGSWSHMDPHPTDHRPVLSDLHQCLNRYALDGKYESLEAFLNEAECDDEGIVDFESSCSEASTKATTAGAPPSGHKRRTTLGSAPPRGESMNRRRLPPPPTGEKENQNVVDGDSLEGVMRELSCKLDKLINSSRKMTTEVKGITNKFRECDQRLNIVQAKANRLKSLRSESSTVSCESLTRREPLTVSQMEKMLLDKSTSNHRARNPSSRLEGSINSYSTLSNLSLATNQEEDPAYIRIQQPIANVSRRKKNQVNSFRNSNSIIV